MDPESIDELYARWQKNPDAAETAALCDALRGGRRPDLVDIVGGHASQQPDVATLLAAGRMYTDSGRLDDAQSVLLAAGRIAPRDGDVYRWLGEVLLRRGDAERAEKVLGKAVEFGADRSAGSLLERARALVPIQQSVGTNAVADAVAKSASPYLRAPPAKPSSARSVAATQSPPRHVRMVPPDSDDEVETKIREHADVQAAMDAALEPAGGLAPPLAAGLPPPSVPPIPLPPPSGPPAPIGRPVVQVPPPDDLVFTTPTRGVSFDIQPEPQTYEDEISSASARRIGPDDPEPKPTAAAKTAAFGSVNSERSRNENAWEAREAQRSRGRERAPEPTPRGRQVEPPIHPKLLEALARPPVSVGGAATPEPRDVLDALQIAGVYEPEGAVGPQVFTWSKPQGVRRLFSTATLVVLALVLVGGGIGTFHYVNGQRAKAHVEAERLLAVVDKDLQASDAQRLEGAEKSISRAFELESRSPHAALTWLHERALVGLLKGGADLAFEDSIQRAKAVGIDEKRIAFAHVASFLFQGDTAGAAATVAKWDAAASGDAWFQLIAGATFERAGDGRALDRYTASVKLAPELFISQLLATRAMAVDGDHKRAGDVAKELHTTHPDRLESAALVVLVWTRDPLRGDPPPEVKDVTERAEGLPVSLRTVPFAARAIVALHKGAVDEARPQIQKGLDVVDTPGVAAWLGGIALVMGDETLARKAALAAVSFSAVHPPARVLAARVALLGARLDEALKATEDLPPSSPDVAVVTAAASYEKLDGARMASALDAMPDDAKKQPFVLALVRGQALLAGNLGGLTGEKVVDMADDEAPWSDLVAMDFMLDAGELDLAKKIAERWRGDPRSMRAIRLARLARYDGKLEDADKYSKIALDTGTVTMRALMERVFTLVALKKDTEALALFRHYPNVGGPLAKWLRAYAVAAHGKLDEARAIVSQEDPPPTAAPMPSRVLAASAYAMMKDTRHGNEYTKPIALAGFANPDVAFAAEKLGVGKVVRRKW